MTKLDKIIDRLNSMDSILAAQHESLKDHIRRTELLEEELRPVKKHVAMVEGAFKLIGLVGLLATIVETIHMIFK